MIKIFRTDDGILNQVSEYLPGAWVQLTKPTEEESRKISAWFEVDIDDIKAAMDDEESSRLDVEINYTLLLVDIPAVEIRHANRAYTTIPLGIVITLENVITVCAEETPVLEYFVKNVVKEFSTKKKMRFVYQILYRTCMVYQNDLRIIDRKRVEIESKIGNSTEDEDLIALHELESTLVYFATSLSANGVILDRLSRYGRIRQYQEDKELLEDVIVENKQAIEMTSIYRDIINGTRELLSSIIDNRLNNVMKYLAGITIVMSVPTIISGIFGMNVDERWIPLSHVPFGFEILCFLMLLISLLIMWILKKRKML